MGFFTSRKTENTDIHLAVTSATVDGERSVVNAIRSRFIGKGKGKEREEPPTTFVQSVSVADTLSGNLPTATRTKSSGFLSKSSSISLRTGPGTSRLKARAHELNNPSTPHRNPASTTAAPTPSSSSPRNSLDSRHGAIPRPRSNPPASSYSRNSITTDSATSTLAQRLNELASANAQGLLDDDEYRVLRQNLFERFASSAVVPTEAPVVPVMIPTTRRVDAQGTSRPVSRPLSNFQIDVERPPSVVSQNSGSFSVSSFVKRATSRRTGGGSKDYSETSSIFSSASKSSNFFRRGITRKSSNGSVRTTTSRTQADSISISSRQTALESDRGQSEPTRSIYSTPRSGASMRRFQTPPSSFNHRILETRHVPHASDIFDDDQPKSASELRQEILAVEAEARRLMDAFNGLEVTTLAKLQRQQHGQASSEDTGTLPFASHHDGQSVRRLDPDALSIRSGTSIGTSHSTKHITSSARKPFMRGSWNPSISLGSTSSLRRKDSASSFGSQERLPSARTRNLPPIPALPAAYGHLKLGSASNLSLSRSAGHLAMTSVPENNSLTMTDSPVQELTATSDMEDIRRRRAEVNRRYDARLEYLRARLKGAELHEKLARK